MFHINPGIKRIFSLFTEVWQTIIYYYCDDDYCDVAWQGSDDDADTFCSTEVKSRCGHNLLYLWLAFTLLPRSSGHT
jgi:hypothetical protein